MVKELQLITDDCAVPISEIVSVVRTEQKGVNESNQWQMYYSVSLLLDRQVSPVNIPCKTKEERDELFKSILEKQAEYFKENS